MCVATNASHALEGEVERHASESSAGQERNQKRAKTCVDMEREPFAEGKARKGRDVINDSMRVVWCRTNEQNGIAIDEARYRGDLRAIIWAWTGNKVDSDAKV